MNLNKLAIALTINRPYDAKMIYNWSLGLIGDKKKAAIELMVIQFEEAIGEKHRAGEVVPMNFFYLLEELKDRAKDPMWRMQWES